MALALESWTWRADRLERPLYARAEPKPSAFGVEGGPPTADLVVAGMNEKFDDFDYKTTPRVWIELKERGTWWGVTPGLAAKAFGTSNNGIRSDLEKWKDVRGRGDVVLVCQITMHDGTYKEGLPESWTKQLDDIAGQYDRAVPARCVGFEIAGKDRVRWTRFDAFMVNPG
jgi:hypothetical protein